MHMRFSVALPRNKMAGRKANGTVQQFGLWGEVALAYTCRARFEMVGVERKGQALAPRRSVFNLHKILLTVKLPYSPYLFISTTVGRKTKRT